MKRLFRSLGARCDELKGSTPVALCGVTLLLLAGGKGFASEPFDGSVRPDRLSSWRPSERSPAEQVAVGLPAIRARNSFASGADLERLLDRYGSEEKELEEELGQVEPARELLERRMVARGRAYYRKLRDGLLPSGAGFDSLVNHAAAVEKLRRSIERDLAAHASLDTRSRALGERLERIRAERAPLEVQRAAMENARVALAQVEERKAAFERAFDATSADYAAVYGADLGPSGPTAPASKDGRRPFETLRGKLAMPLAGRMEVRRVTHPSSGGPGLELVAATPGAAVRAVGAGRVAFVDQYDALGLTVIIDHGQRYFSVYGNLAEARVRAGDTIPAGGRIGRVREDRSAMLYFELRHGTAPVDARPWLGI